MFMNNIHFGVCFTIRIVCILLFDTFQYRTFFLDDIKIYINFIL